MIEEGSTPPKEKSLEKSPTGINGLDDITEGGLPTGRPTLVCGSAGSGKTLMAMEFLVKGAQKFDEPGVFMAFEETSEDLSKNFASLEFDLDDLEAKNKLVVDYVHIDKSEIEETGEYDLEGLFIRLGLAIDSIGARRVALDTLEVLFSGFQNEAILRSELRRLFRWLKNKGVTAIVTGERGERCLYFTFEESPSQITRNMKSIGIDFQPYIGYRPHADKCLPAHGFRPGNPSTTKVFTN